MNSISGAKKKENKTNSEKTEKKKKGTQYKEATSQPRASTDKGEVHVLQNQYIVNRNGATETH